MKKFLLALIAIVAVAFGSRADSPAVFPGGADAQNDYFVTNLVYPETARDNGIEGVVVVMFTVRTDGSVGNIKIKRMVDPDLESEAIRLVKQMPAWTPAKDGAGRPVESTATVDVAFHLD